MNEKMYWNIAGIAGVIVNLMMMFILHNGILLPLTIPMTISFFYASKREG